MAWLVVLFAIWAFPIISYFALKLTQNKNRQHRKTIFIYTAIAVALSTFSLLTEISTTLPILDWSVLTSFYFLVCLILWWTQFQNNKLIKICGGVSLIITFGIGYLSGSVGILGIAFVTGEYEVDIQKWIGNGFIYKESVLGNAISDHRGKKVEVYKTLSWLPIIEWKVVERKYNTLIVYPGNLDMNYKQNEQAIYLSKTMKWGKENKTITWKDTINLAK